MFQAVAADDPFGMVDPVAYWGQVQPNRLAIRDFSSGLSVSYLEFDRRIDRCAALIEQTLGEPVGERVAVLSRNSLDFMAVHFACVRIGAIFTPLNWRLSAPEISVLVQDSGPRLLFVEAEFQPVADALTGGHSLQQVMSLEPQPFQALLDAAPAISPATWNSGMSHIMTLEAESRVQRAKLMLEARALRSETITPLGRPVVPEV